MDSVKILGAGPAGLSAAINLADEGFSVEVYERNKDVGVGVKRNLQGLENWTEKQDVVKEFKAMNIHCNFEYEPFKELTITNNTEDWNFTCKKPAFYLIKRGTDNNSLDQCLMEQALESDVDIKFSDPLAEEEADIVATGHDPRYKFAVGKGLTFKTDHENLAVGMVNNHYACKGYSYLLISNGCGCMATVLFENFKDLNKYFDRTLDAFLGRYPIKTEDPNTFAGYGSFSSEILKNENQILVGERAGFQDLLWGFGIRNAIKSGYMAAKCIINGDDPRDYYEAVEKYFKTKLNSGVVNRFIWERLGSNNYSFLLNRIHNSKDPLKYLNSFHNFNLLQKITYPLALFYMKNRYPNLKL